jgi:hypothetical protein
MRKDCVLNGSAPMSPSRGRRGYFCQSWIRQPGRSRTETSGTGNLIPATNHSQRCQFEESIHPKTVYDNDVTPCIDSPLLFRPRRLFRDPYRDANGASIGADYDRRCFKRSSAAASLALHSIAGSARIRSTVSCAICGAHFSASMIFLFVRAQHPARVITLPTTLSSKSNNLSCSLLHLEFNRLRAEMRVTRNKDDLSRLFGSANPNRRCPPPRPLDYPR